MRNGSRLLRVPTLLLAALAVAAMADSATGAADVKLISQGREVTLEDHLVPGKLVVFDFFAEWCAPCRYVTPVLEQLAAEHPDRLALRTIDVIDWSSPVAKQHGLSAIPHLVLFGPDGSRLADGDAERVLSVLNAQLGGVGSGVAVARGGPGVPAPVWIALVAALIGGSIVLRRRGRQSAAAPPSTPAQPADDAAGSARIWYAVLRGSLDGPFSIEQLAELERSGTLAGKVPVRRRGDATWRRLEDVTRGQ